MLHGYRKQFGQKGEDLASKFLQKQGYQIIDKNFRIRNGEIDIIAIDNSEAMPTLVFIEVKTRFSDFFGDPLESITYFKMKALQRTALIYQQKYPNLPSLLRLDAVAVILDHSEQVKEIRLIKNIS